MGKIVVIGSSNTDMVVTTPKLPNPGETLLGSEFNVHPGGKGANQAVASARAGANVVFMAKVGDDDFGRRAIEGYKLDGINVDYIYTEKDHASGIAVILVEEVSGQNSIVVAGGANNYLLAQDLCHVEKIISEADVELLQLEIPLETVDAALKIAVDHGVRTVLNPAPARALSDELLRMVDVITPNESETEILTGIYPVDIDTTARAAELLLEKVNMAVIITLGSQGAYFLDKNGEKGYIPASKVKAVDSTAAGDVFNGYLAAALADGKSLKESISLSNSAAALSVTKQGAQPSIPRCGELTG